MMDTLTQHRKARLRHLIDGPPFFGNQAELARHAGLSKGRINQLLDPGAPFGERSATKLALNLDLSPHYFELGYQKSAFMTPHDEAVAGALKTHPIPVVSETEAANWLESVQDFEPEETKEWLLTSFDVSSGAFGLKIRDEAMTPKFIPGDMVIIDPAVLPIPGDYVAAACGKDPAVFRKYRPRRIDMEGRVIFDLVALNQDHPVLSSDVQAIMIIGTMTEHRRYRKTPKN